MKNRKLTPPEIKAAKESNNYKFTQTELEAVILVQRRIIESQAKELKLLKGSKDVYCSQAGELPETD